MRAIFEVDKVGNHNGLYEDISFASLAYELLEKWQRDTTWI